LDVPAGTEWGLDRKIWTIGDQFKGMKMVPPGLHLMTWSAGHDHRTGMFLLLSQGEVVVHRWDASLESFSEAASVGDGSISEEEKERYASGFRNFEFDSQTAPYDMEGDGVAWTRLTRYVTESCLKKATIDPGTHSWRRP